MTRKVAEIRSPADAVRLSAIVGPQDVIAWQQTTVDELHGLCWLGLAGDVCCFPACWLIAMELDPDCA